MLPKIDPSPQMTWRKSRMRCCDPELPPENMNQRREERPRQFGATALPASCQLWRHVLEPLLVVAAEAHLAPRPYAADCSPLPPRSARLNELKLERRGGARHAERDLHRGHVVLGLADGGVGPSPLGDDIDPPSRPPPR